MREGEVIRPHLLCAPSIGPFCQEVDGVDPEMSGTLQAKRRALLGQKDRLRLLKKMQSGKERVQRKMERGRSSKGEGMRGGEIDSIPEIKPAVREARYELVAPVLAFNFCPYTCFYKSFMSSDNLERHPSPVRPQFSPQSNWQSLRRPYHGRLRPGSIHDDYPRYRVLQRHSQRPRESGRC